jgi:hypothetical protein
MLKRTLKLVINLCLVICLWPAAAWALDHKFTDVTILVSSCDKYSSLWEPFFGSLLKHWPSLQAHNSGVPIILIANTQHYNHPRVKTIKIAHETSWADNMLVALQQVNTPYVLVLLDDYWLDKPVDEKRLAQLLKILREGNTAFIQTSFNTLRFQNGSAHENIAGVVYRKKFSHYKVSLQAGLWDKTSLEYLLRSGENPWDFEIMGSLRAHGYPKAFLSLVNDEPIHYLNASHLGHITPEAIAYAKVQNLHFEPGNFPRLGQFNWRISKRIWLERGKKLLGFLKNPGLFYEFEAS